MSFWKGLVDYFFPVRCCACKTLVDRSEGLLCESCMEEYRDATKRVCPLCVKPLRECDCPNIYMEHKNLHTLVKLYRYQVGESDLAENRMIFRLKQTSDITVAEFLADELFPCIKRHIKSEKDYILVGVPRSKRAIQMFGDDHTKLLCKELSKRLQIPYVPAVRRVKDGKAQKTKRRRERIESASKSYAPRRKISLKGKVVILVDDIATTGASLTACAKVVRRMGAKTIICAVVGVAFRYHDLVKDSDYYAERRNKFGI